MSDIRVTSVEDTLDGESISDVSLTSLDGGRGPQGPQGEAGPAGPTGATGPTGPAGADGVVQAIVAGTNVTVDSTDPANPVVSASGGGGGTGTVASVVAGSGISVDSTDPANPIVSNAGATAAQGALADSATQPGDLSTVATSGAYSDLTGKPTLGTAAAAATGDFDAAGSASSAQAAAIAASQPLDADLTAIAALTTATFGRSLLTAADAAGARALTGAGTSSLAIGTTSTTAAAGNDARLSDARTPTAHAASHASAGSDPVTLAESQVTGLTTDLAGKVPTTRTVAGHALSADVTLVKGDVGLGNVDNTADTAKPVSTAQQTALDLKAPLASPALTGNPTAPTPTAGDNDTSIATTAFVASAVSPLAPLASPTFTGHPVGVTETAGNNSTRLATTAYADNAVAKQPEAFVFALGDETTAITTGTKVTWRIPFAFTLTQIRASLTTASSSGIPAFDVKKNGTTVFSTTVTIDATEKTSQTAATAAVLSTTALADDDELTFIVNTAGTGAAGAKITLIGTRA